MSGQAGGFSPLFLVIELGAEAPPSPLPHSLPRSLPRSPGRRGLSLIEVLLALTIFLMSLVAIARLVDMGTDREMDARFQNRGTRLAQAKLAEIESGASDLTATEGQFDGDDSAWSWTMSVEAQSAPSLNLVTVTVTRDLKGQPFTVTLSQMILDPAVLGTAGEAARPDGTSGGNSP